MFRIYDLGYDEFDLLLTQDNESIRNLVNRKYPEADEQTKYQAMIMEAVRHAMTDGIRVLDIRLSAPGETDAHGDPLPEGSFVLDTNSRFFGRTSAELATEQAGRIEQELQDTREARMALLYTPEGQIKKSVDDLTLEQQRQTEVLYDQIYGSVLRSPAMRRYRELHPETEDVDLFHVNGIPLRDYLGQERLQTLSGQGGALLKAEILRLTTDLSIPFTVTPAGYHSEDNTYLLTDPISILDLAEKKRVQIEYPYLNTLEDYKTWAANTYGVANPDQMGDDQWNALYQWEFYQKASAGLHRADRVLTEEQLANIQEDPELPHSLTFEGIKTVYGPKPSMVEGWMGDGANYVYTRDNFNRFMNDLPQGGFSDEEFTLLAYHASASASVVTEDLLPNVPDAWISRQDKLQSRATMWTTDFIVFYPKPRADLGNNFFENPIRPAREAASQMIRDYENGDPGRMADRIKEGLIFQMQSVQTLGDLRNPKGAAALHLMILRKTANMLEKYPELKTAVLDRMSEEEKENFKAILRMEELQTGYFHAVARMNQAESTGEPMTDMEKEGIDRTIYAFGAYACRWKACSDEFHNSQEFLNMAFQRANVMAQRIQEQEQPNDGPRNANTCEMDLYCLKHMKLDGEIRQELLSEDPYRYGESLRYNVVRMEEFYRDKWQRLEDATNIRNTVRGVNYTEEFSPEECDMASVEREICVQQLEGFKNLVESRLSASQTDRIRAEYNTLAAQNGWPPINNYDLDKANQSPARFPQRFKALFDIVMKEVRREPFTAYRMEEELEKLRAPFELPEADKKDYPMDPQLEGIRRRNPHLSREDRLLLDRVSGYLAETKPEVKDSLARANDRGNGDFLREEGMLRSIPGYDPESHGFSGLLQKKEAAGSHLPVQVVPEKFSDNARAVLANPPQPSDDLLGKGVQVIQMMEHYQMLEPGDEMPYGSKVYSHHKTAKARMDLIRAVDRANVNEIRQKAEAYRLAFEKEKTIFDHLKATMGEETGVPSGMDSLRERSVDPAFSQDVVTDSRMNALYKVGITAKKLNVPILDYVKDPGRYLKNAVQQRIAEVGFAAQTKPEDDFATAMKKLYTSGERFFRRRNLKNQVLESADGQTYVKEAIGNLYRMETDPERRKAMLGYQRQLGQLIDAAVERENAACISVYHTLRPGTEADAKAQRALMEGLKLAFLQGEGIKKEHLNIAYTNADGEEIPRPADYRERLSQPNDYARLTQLYRRNLENARKTDLTETKLILQETLLDYLLAHPEDKGTREYRNLEKLAFDADRDLGIAPPRNAEEAAKRPRARFERRKREFETELRNLENAAVRADLEVNRNLQTLQRQADAALRGRHPNRNEAWDRIRQIEEAVQARQEQLMTAWQKHEITDSYFRTRYNDLHELLLQPGGRVKTPPKFTDRRNAAQYAEDLALINNRLDYSFGKRSFKNLESYKESRRNRPDADPAAYANTTDDDWKAMYRVDLYSTTRQKGTPGWIRTKQAEAAESIRIRGEQRAAANNQANHAAANNQANHVPANHPVAGPGMGGH